MTWAWAEFKKKENPICPTERPISFIVSGPFRFTRNPMYLGIALMLAAPAFWLGAPIFLIAPIGFLAVVATVFVPFEEKRLTEEFGAEFSSYTSRVRRWI
jgi:protein-S-isoprenylcysteine O-methyltransferase Ste14